MNITVATADSAAITEQCSVESGPDKFRIESVTKFYAAFTSVNAALEYPAKDLPSGSIVVDAIGKVRATLERHWNSAGTKQSPVWILAGGQ